MGSRCAPHLLFLLRTICPGRRVVPFVVAARAVPAHVAIVRGGLIALRTKAVVSALCRGFGWRGGLHRRGKNGRRGDQQQKTQTFFHESSSEVSSGPPY
jgi:hypothetical protein